MPLSSENPLTLFFIVHRLVSLYNTLLLLYTMVINDQFRADLKPFFQNYYEIIKKPMDLQTIGKKLDQGKYSNPWEFIEDMHLIFDNASTYNRKNSRPYKCSLKLFEKFQLEIDPVMKQMGYCCGERLHFTHLSLLCYGTGKVNCIIPRDQEYYRYEVPSTQYAQYGISGGEVEKYIYCLKCFNELPEEGLNLSENPNDPPKYDIKAYKLIY